MRRLLVKVVGVCKPKIVLYLNECNWNNKPGEVVLVNLKAGSHFSIQKNLNCTFANLLSLLFVLLFFYQIYFFLHSPVATAFLILSSSWIRSYISHLLFFAASQLLFLSTNIIHYNLRQSTQNTERQGKFNHLVIVIVPLKPVLFSCFLLFIWFFFLKFSFNRLSYQVNFDDLSLWKSLP